MLAVEVDGKGTAFQAGKSMKVFSFSFRELGRECAVRRRPALSHAHAGAHLDGTV